MPTHHSPARSRARNGMIAAAAVLLSVLSPVAVASAQEADPTVEVVNALANGRGMQAADTIARSDLQHDPQKLGHTTNKAGTKAVEQETGDRYREAVAVAFTQGGVDIVTASQAFGSAATEAVAGGLTPEKALVGGSTVAQTYEAYLLVPRA